ncbi:hypothetical protein BBJ28_00016041 [Nothophytophthora sp. Chile5]|nr:hypothetical protein BBJ28_00016041 [Nothophytophthora sp. Chile5]
MLRVAQSSLRSRSLVAVRSPLLRQRFSQCAAVLEPSPSPALEAPATIALEGEMNVTRHNFESCFADLQRDILRPTCRFVAIDTEFTGLSPNEYEKERYLDTLEERYRKVKRAGESFLITQFGLSTVHVDKNEQFQIKTWNFYVFPRPYGTQDERFLCQASSLQFLSEHGFDFNKFIADGIPFLNLSKTTVMKKRLQRRIDGLNKVNKNLNLSEEGLAFQKEVNAKLDQWIADGAKKGEKLLLPTRNSFFSMVVHETVRAKASYLYSESAEGGVEVSYVSKKIKEELIAARVKEMERELADAIGFSKVIEVLSASKKPIVGHNALLDFVYVFHQFYKPLPDTLAEFKTELLELFPSIYDTKHVTLRSPLGDQLKSTGLSSLFEYMRENVKPSPESLIPSDERFDTYRAALKDEADGNESMLCHEAGFDAFMTAVCFLGLVAHDANGELPDQDQKEGSSARLTLRLEELESYKNRLNLMISDESSLDLGNVAQTIDRARVYRVTSTTKRKLQHVRMEDVFKTSKVQRVLRENDQNAFVVLSEPAEDVNEEAIAKLGVSITTYDDHVAAKAEEARLQKEEEEQKVFEKLSAGRAESEPHQAPVFPACTESEKVKEGESIMSIESEERGASPEGVRATASPTGRHQREAKRAELQRLRERIKEARADVDDDGAPLSSQPQVNMDPLSCLCMMRADRRVVATNGSGVETKLLLVGPHWIGVLVTLAIILVSTGMFLTQQCADMPWYYTAMTLALCGMTLYYLFQTTCTDPGIVRSSRLKDTTVCADDEDEAATLEAGHRAVPSDSGRVGATTQLLPAPPAGGLGPRRRPAERTRYCDICDIEQDRSTDHCEDCGVCVAGYDHHCPWMGKCIGRGNMHAFKMFNVAWVLYVSFTLFVAITSVDWGRAAEQTLERTASGAWTPVPNQH